MAGLVPSLILRMNVRLSNIELASTCTLSLLCQGYVHDVKIQCLISCSLCNIRDLNDTGPRNGLLCT